MIEVYPLSLFALAGVCVIGGWAYGFTFGRYHAPKGTQPLYGDHLKVHEIRQWLRGMPPDREAAFYIMEKIRKIIGDAEYREF